MRQPPTIEDRKRPAGWWTQAVAWWGIAVFAASIAGCVWLIVIAERYADPALPATGHHVMDVPLTRPVPSSQASPSSSPDRASSTGSHPGRSPRSP